MLTVYLIQTFLYSNTLSCEYLIILKKMWINHKSSNLLELKLNYEYEFNIISNNYWTWKLNFLDKFKVKFCIFNSPLEYSLENFILYWNLIINMSFQEWNSIQLKKLQSQYDNVFMRYGFDHLISLNIVFCH